MRLRTLEISRLRFKWAPSGPGVGPEPVGVAEPETPAGSIPLMSPGRFWEIRPQ